MKKAAAKETLFEQASRMFMDSGYENVSVNDIVEAASVHKTTFYRCWTSKEELGLEYLDLLEGLFLENFAAMRKNSKSLSEFLDHWASYWAGHFDGGEFRGCPVAGFSAHVEALGADAFPERVAEIINVYVDRLSDYICEYAREGSLDADLREKPAARALAEELFIVYEGAVLLARMTGKRAHLETGRRMLHAAAARALRAA